MAWVLIDDNFPSHPKAVQAGPVASYLFVCGLCYCRRYHTGGFIPERAIAQLGVTTAPRRLVAALMESGLWDRADGGYRVHGYDGMYADDADKAMKDEVARQKREAGKKGGVASGQSRASKTQGASHSASSRTGLLLQAQGGTGTGERDLSVLVPEEEKRTQAFNDFWSAYPRKDKKQVAREQWDKLNPNEDVQRLIAADLERRCRSTQWLKDAGNFIPMPSTYLHQKRWEDGFVERPRLADKTIKVLKGFEEPTGT